jgi:hypothetical protein
MDKISFIFNELSEFIFLEFETLRDCRSLSASGGLPHLLRQMPSRIVDYSETGSSLYMRQHSQRRASLDNRSIQV